MERSREFLKQLQALPLSSKINRTQSLIIAWHHHFDGKVFVSLSGGKDSTVALHIARQIYPDIKACFCNTGLEYPEIQSFAKGLGNVDIIRPAMKFNEVITKYGYPIISKEVSQTIHYARLKDGNYTKYARKKLLGLENVHSRFQQTKWLPICLNTPFRISHYCCTVMKKRPMGKYEKEIKSKPILGTMAEESQLREAAWLRHGCNAFDNYRQTSQPLSFWTEQDILTYIKQYGVDIASVYGDIVEETKEHQISVGGCGKLTCTGCKRTGCIFCGFGVHLEKDEHRFVKLKQTHPKQYDYCINGGEWVDNPDYDPDYNGEPDEMGWIKWNPEKLWVPSKQGLGMGFVFDTCNRIIGKEIWKY